MTEKVSALRTEKYFERASRANRQETIRILKRAGKRNSPMAGDELPSDWEIDFEKRKAVPNHSREKIKSLGQRRKRKTQS
jgi:hypothetical protein